VLLYEAPAVAKAAIETGVARVEIDTETYREHLALRRGQGEYVRHFIMNRARQAPKRVVFGEGEQTKILRAAARVAEEGIGHPILLGREQVISEKIHELGLDIDVQVIDPAASDKLQEYADGYYKIRVRKGMTRESAMRRTLSPNIFGPMMVRQGDADAFVSGLTYDYPEVIKPALEIFHTRPGAERAAGVYLMIVDNRVYVFSDATVNIDPSSEDLAEIAILAADFARQLEIEPRVAMLSFSNFGSTRHPLTDKVRKAVALVKNKRPDLAVDGEMQADTAVVPSLVDERYAFSLVRDANVLVFPSLESANVAYKLLSRLGKARAIGPILVGIGAPVHVLQTGDDVDDIVHMAAVAVMDSQLRDKDA